MEQKFHRHIEAKRDCGWTGKRLVPIPALNGRTQLQCIRFFDPVKSEAAKWASGPLAAGAGSPQIEAGSVVFSKG
jgi:hypothetical protein